MGCSDMDHRVGSNGKSGRLGTFQITMGRIGLDYTIWRALWKLFGGGRRVKKVTSSGKFASCAHCTVITRVTHKSQHPIDA